MKCDICGKNTIINYGNSTSSRCEKHSTDAPPEFEPEIHIKKQLQKSKNALITLKIIWVSIFALFGFLSLGAYGEETMGFLIVHLFLTFPSGILLIFLFQTLPSPLIPGGIIGSLLVNVSFFVIGYWQWFVFIPWLSNKFKK